VKGEGDAADALYTAPPSDFTRVRDALVRNCDPPAKRR
jgi:hypothetical protein